MPFMTSAQFDEFDPLIREGMATLQAYAKPAPIQLRRRDATSGNFANAGPAFTPIDVKLADRLEQVTGANAGRVEIVNGGTFRAFTPLDVRRDDRFAVNGATAEVTLVEPVKRGGYVTVNFRLLGG